MMQDETAAAAEAAGTPEEAIANNEFVDGAMGAFHGLTDGDVTTTDLVALWSAIGWPIAKALLLIIAVLLIAGWAKGITRRALSKAGLEVTLSQFLSNLVRWVVLLIGAVTVMQTFGIEATSFAAVIAAVGFAIGMALSGTLGHVASGVMLLIFRPFKVGDVIRGAGVFGTVTEIGLFTTHIDTFDKRRIIVPNSKLFDDTIENVTFHDVRRADVSLGTSYDADIDETRAVLERVVASVAGAKQDPAPQVFLGELGGSSIDWTLRVWAHADDFWTMRENLIRDTKKALEEANIGIPYPQMDVHVDGAIQR